MTDVQKFVIDELLQDGTVALVRPGVYSIRDKEGNPRRRFTSRTWYHLKMFCKRNKRMPLYLIDKKLVRSLNGNTYINKKYWELLHGKTRKSEKN